MNPFVAGAPPGERETLPVFKEFDWDFEKDSFIMNPDGTHRIVEKNEAIKVWVMHVLKVERYRYLAYFDDYGIELEPFIGTGANDGERASRLYQYVKQGLLVNPYIVDVTAMSTKLDHKKITMSIKLETIYGSTSVGIEV